MPAVQIRPARAADAAAACEVLRRSIAELCAADHRNDAQFLARWLANKTPQNIAAWIADAGSFVYVALDGGRITGVAAMTNAGLITLNYVAPDARFKGVSKALLAALEGKAAELGLAQCTLASTKTARNFYLAAGYREQEGADAAACLAMVKNLA